MEPRGSWGAADRELWSAWEIVQSCSGHSAGDFDCENAGEQTVKIYLRGQQIGVCGECEEHSHTKS